MFSLHQLQTLHEQSPAKSPSPTGELNHGFPQTKSPAVSGGTFTLFHIKSFNGIFFEML
jgi:hypothetical protein